MHSLSFLAAMLFVTATASPSGSVSSSLSNRQIDYTPIDVAPLRLGTCRGYGICYPEESGANDCYTDGCHSDALGYPCSCNVNVQKEINRFIVEGRKYFPVKCPYGDAR